MRRRKRDGMRRKRGGMRRRKRGGMRRTTSGKKTSNPRIDLGAAVVQAGQEPALMIVHPRGPGRRQRRPSQRGA